MNLILLANNIRDDESHHFNINEIVTNIFNCIDEVNIFLVTTHNKSNYRLKNVTYLYVPSNINIDNALIFSSLYLKDIIDFDVNESIVACPIELMNSKEILLNIKELYLNSKRNDAIHINLLKDFSKRPTIFTISRIINYLSSNNIKANYFEMLKLMPITNKVVL